MMSGCQFRNVEFEPHQRPLCFREQETLPLLLRTDLVKYCQNKMSSENLIKPVQ